MTEPYVTLTEPLLTTSEATEGVTRLSPSSTGHHAALTLTDIRHTTLHPDRRDHVPPSTLLPTRLPARIITSAANETVCKDRDLQRGLSLLSSTEDATDAPGDEQIITLESRRPTRPHLGAAVRPRPLVTRMAIFSLLANKFARRYAN
jgi:hypothetical protein